MAARIGFIGAGGIAGHHMRTLAGNSDAEMVAFADLDVERARSAAKTYGGKGYSSYKTMLAKAELDGVFICIPPFAHKNQERDIIEAGLPFFTEKPVGLSVKRCENNLELISQKDTITSVGYHWRSQDATAAAKKTIAGKKVSLVHGQWVGGMPGVPWWRRMDGSGGQAVEQTTHIFDLARYLVGDVAEVYAAASTGNMTDVENYDVHDSSSATLTFKSGTVGTILSSCVSGAGGGEFLKLYLRDETLTVSGELVCETPGRKEQMSGKANPTDVEERAFIKAITTGKRGDILCDYADALETLKLTLAVNKSIQTGRAVKLS